jgi:hypothetical protein
MESAAAFFRMATVRGDRFGFGERVRILPS